MIIAKDSHIANIHGVLYIRNNWSSGRGITYTRSNKLYHTGCFSGTAEELIKKSKKDCIFQNICKDKPIKFKELINFVNKSYDEQ